MTPKQRAYKEADEVFEEALLSLDQGTFSSWLAGVYGWMQLKMNTEDVKHIRQRLAEKKADVMKL